MNIQEIFDLASKARKLESLNEIIGGYEREKKNIGKNGSPDYDDLDGGPGRSFYIPLALQEEFLTKIIDYYTKVKEELSAELNDFIIVKAEKAINPLLSPVIPVEKVVQKETQKLWVAQRVGRDNVKRTQFIKEGTKQSDVQIAYNQVTPLIFYAKKFISLEECDAWISGIKEKDMFVSAPAEFKDNAYSLL